MRFDLGLCIGEPVPSSFSTFFLPSLVRKKQSLLHLSLCFLHGFGILARERKKEEGEKKIFTRTKDSVAVRRSPKLAVVPCGSGSENCLSLLGLVPYLSISTPVGLISAPLSLVLHCSGFLGVQLRLRCPKKTIF